LAFDGQGLALTKDKFVLVTADAKKFIGERRPGLARAKPDLLNFLAALTGGFGFGDPACGFGDFEPACLFLFDANKGAVGHGANDRPVGIGLGADI
jgi:hypothetical protein